MTASQFSALFVSALLSNTIIKLWLAFRQLAHVAANRAEVPAAFREKVGLAAHQKAADYTRA
ncbi:MAG TPA: M48 family peptidase, partial [Sideroxyarcus sp.]|nr:M48 family peptidase [Sideroxyarcus sp.]